MVIPGQRTTKQEEQFKNDDNTANISTKMGTMARSKASEGKQTKRKEQKRDMDISYFSQNVSEQGKGKRTV